MLLLALSLLVLAAAPVLYRLARTTRPALAALDGFVLVAILGIVMLLVLPHSVATAGWWALAAGAVGVTAPGFLEKLLHRSAGKAHAAALFLGLGGIALHAFFDGVALAQGPEGGASARMLAMAVVLHRLPDGLAIWWLLLPSYGRRIAILGLVTTALATLLGYFASGALTGAASSPQLGIVQALVAGSLLHVIVHRPDPEVDRPTARTWRLHAGLGALAALPLLYLLFTADGGHHLPIDLRGTRTAFVSLAVESAPALVIAYLAAGLIHAFLPRATTAWVGRGNLLSQALRGMAFGLPLPLCSCGVIPVYRGLVLRGIPPAAGMAFLVATPELGVDAFLLSFPLLGANMALARLVGAALVALLVGVLLGWLTARSSAAVPSVPVPEEPPAGPAGARLAAGLRVGLGEMVDSTAPWILLGLAIAAIGAELLDPAWIAALPRGIDVLLLAGLGLPAYVCASGATPLVAMLLAKGVSPGAALAFLLTGPATNATTFGVLSALHGKRIAALFGLSVASAAVGLGYLVNAVLPRLDLAPIAHGGAEHRTHVGEVALGLLALLVILSLLRQGPRRFVGQVMASAQDHDHGDDHDHDHDHHHEHDHARGGAGCCSSCSPSSESAAKGAPAKP